MFAPISGLILAYPQPSELCCNPRPCKSVRQARYGTVEFNVSLRQSIGHFGDGECVKSSIDVVSRVSMRTHAERDIVITNSVCLSDCQSDAGTV